MTTKTEERYIAKATNGQYFTRSFTQKNVLLFAFDIDLLFALFAFDIDLLVHAL